MDVEDLGRQLAAEIDGTSVTGILARAKEIAALLK